MQIPMNTTPLTSYDYFDPRVLSDPYDFYVRLRRESPVFKVYDPDLRLEMYLVTTYALIREVAGDSQTYSSDFAHVLFGGGRTNAQADAIIASTPCEPTLLLTTDDPVHKRRRSLVSGAFTPRSVAKISASIETITDTLIDEFIERGECDFVREFALRLPTYIIADILGVPREHWPLVTDCSDAIILRVGKMATAEQEVAAAQRIVEFRKFIQDTIRERRRKPGDDLLSTVMQLDTNGEPPLTDYELLSFAQEVLVGGNETTRNTLIAGLARLLRHPEQLQLLRNEPALAANAVEEILRLETPASAMWRIATRDTELGGVRLPKGAVLSLRYDSGNRDEVQFPNANALDIRRANAREHLSFSYGGHYCLGSNLARRELTLTLPKLLARLNNLRIVPEKSDLTYYPNVMIRALRALHLAFDPAPRLAA